LGGGKVKRLRNKVIAWATEETACARTARERTQQTEEKENTSTTTRIGKRIKH